MYQKFGLTLMVNHACNLRCSYCYTGAKFSRAMTKEIGEKAILRGFHSLAKKGTLELAFFGGEPLLESSQILHLIEYAKILSHKEDKELSLNLTTNGTISSKEALQIMNLPELSLAISCDGLPKIQDRHRLTKEQGKTSELVLATITNLLNAGKTFKVVMVLRPDTLEYATDGILYLHKLGVNEIDLSLDLWTEWNSENAQQLEKTLMACARVWQENLPALNLNWFNEKLVELTGVKISKSARCGFGQGEIAIAPSGNLYPCERLIGEDKGDMQLTGHTLAGEDFLKVKESAQRADDNCDSCCMLDMCNTYCRCSNYVRTGNVKTPDRLLCLLNQVCLSETARVIKKLKIVPSLNP